MDQSEKMAACLALAIMVFVGAITLVGLVTEAKTKTAQTCIEGGMQWIDGDCVSK